ncbi:MAG: hypothetical protein LUC22_04780 [Prevotella sp.]|nr:hypothetical protein [Prevotella sp.]
MGKYEVKTRFVFSGVFMVEAGSAADAERLIMDACGLVMGGNIHTTLPDDVIDWDFGTHPDKVIDEIIPVSDDSGDEQE